MKTEPKSSCCSSKDPLKETALLQPASGCCASEQEAAGIFEPRQKMEFIVSGMDCPSCAKTIEKCLRTVPDIEEVKINYNTAKMQVFAHHEAAFSPIESEVKKLGFSAVPLPSNDQLKTYHIEGMDCSSCAKSIEKHLINNPFVQSVNVQFSTGKMKIEHSNQVADIISEVAKIGFRADLQDRQKTAPPAPKAKESSLVILSGLLIVLGFVGSLNDVPAFLSTALYAAAIAVSGLKPAKSAFYALKSRSLDMNVLMSAAAIGAALIGEWLEGATVVWLFAIGNFLQTRSIERTRSSIRNLMDLAPPQAWVKSGNGTVKKPVEDVSIGDTIIVKPGDKIPLDGEVFSGESSVNQAAITGESIPADKIAGDAVYAGTLNENGVLEIKVTKLAEDTTIAKIIHLVEEAQEQKAPTEAFVDRFATIYTPIVFVMALVVMVLPPLFGFGAWGSWFYKGLELLVVACPCALVISTPVAIVSAIGNAAKNGVLIKGGTFLEIAGTITAVAFDKTGTLTEGKPKVSGLYVLSGSEKELLSVALTLESHSTHPIAKAIAGFAEEKGAYPKQGELFKNMPGKGVQAMIDGTAYYAGNVKLFEEQGFLSESVKKQVEKEQNQGKTVVMIGTSQQVLGIISVSDVIRAMTSSALQSLKKSGIKQSVMLTGDNEGTAQIIAAEAQVDRYFAELLPEDKVAAVKKLQQEGHRVAMVGDGINDAPALATADLGIAMGGAGTDTAMETADIVLMADNLDKLPHTIKLSKKAMAIIKQNIWFSIAIKAAALALIFPGWLTLWMAVLSDTGAALLVILNALRLLKIKE